MRSSSETPSAPSQADRPVLRPASVEEVQRHVQAALEASEPLEVVGGGSKRFYGRPVEAVRTLSLSGLRGIVDYQPHELILVARPGTPLAELEATLAEKGQMLAFEPPHWGPGATLGGAVACNLAGPRRIRAGAARDHLLGFQAVSGRAEVIRGGGRVVKNVTGYDLSKLMCGSLGTLAVLTELCLKVLPLPETERTVAVPGLDEAAGLALLIAAARTSHDVSALAHLPAGLAPPPAVASLADGGRGLAVLRVEGPGPSVAYRSERLAEQGGPRAVFLEPAESRALWRALRELEPLPLEPGERLWRLSVPPGAAARTGAALERLGAARRYFDWGGGLVWTALPPKVKPAELHALAGEAGGHATLVREAGQRTKGLAVFSPLSAVEHRLHLNLKEAFDPGRILNPGRLYPDL